LPPVPPYANQSPQQKHNRSDPTPIRCSFIYIESQLSQYPTLILHSRTLFNFFSNSQPQTRGEKEIKKNGHVRSGSDGSVKVGIQIYHRTPKSLHRYKSSQSSSVPPRSTLCQPRLLIRVP